MDLFIPIVVGIILLYIFAAGILRVFFNSFWLATLMLFLLPPLLLLWIVVEGIISIFE